MDDPVVLPVYPDEALAGLVPAALVDLLVRDEDRVPRNVIDACAGQGERMVAQLRMLLDDTRPWKDRESLGEWWLALHAVMILGLVAGEPAGRLLVEFMRRMDREKDADLQDWASGWWPALFRNKPDGVVAVLHDLSLDRGVDWFTRANALDAVIAAAEGKGGAALDGALAWAAGIAADQSEDWDFRMSAADTLLDFAPAVHRPLLESLAKMQPRIGASFSSDDLRQAYEQAEPTPEWRIRVDPWEFYRPGVIARRQDRWAEEAAGEPEGEAGLDAFADGPAVPYVRQTPKIGRNDPCPCGSGKKFKKCCLTGGEKY